MATIGDDINASHLARKWLRYYRIEEVDSYLLCLKNQIEAERLEITLLRTKNESMYQEASERTAQTARQEQIIAEQIREIGELGNQLSQSRIENVQLKEQTAQQAVEIKQLKAYIENLNDQIIILERLNNDDNIEETVCKADKIMKKALEDREKMLLQIDEQRGRLIAACRAAYYNALQFKQDLAEHFRNMEQELDASIDVLQILDNSRLILNHNTAQPGTEPSSTKTPRIIDERLPGETATHYICFYALYYFGLADVQSEIVPRITRVPRARKFQLWPSSHWIMTRL